MERGIGAERAFGPRPPPSHPRERRVRRELRAKWTSATTNKSAVRRSSPLASTARSCRVPLRSRARGALPPLPSERRLGRAKGLPGGEMVGRCGPSLRRPHPGPLPKLLLSIGRRSSRSRLRERNLPRRMFYNDLLSVLLPDGSVYPTPSHLPREAILDPFARRWFPADSRRTRSPKCSGFWSVAGTPRPKERESHRASSTLVRRSFRQ